MGLTPSDVYAVDCDEVSTIYDPPMGHSYFRSGKKTRSGKKKGAAGAVFKHIFQTIVTSRTFPNGEYGRTSILDLQRG